MRCRSWTSLIHRFWTQHTQIAEEATGAASMKDNRWRTDTRRADAGRKARTAKTTTTTPSSNTLWALSIGENHRIRQNNRTRQTTGSDKIPDQKSCYERTRSKPHKTPSGNNKLSHAWTGTESSSAPRLSSLTGLQIRSLRHHHDTSIKSNANQGRGVQLGNH